ncbi:AI-2E family transporter [Pusillimonas sp. ANT_WB101]|nr:AI-2E family transporter [Pusillimonas sp. ANT_WB101]
MAESAGKPESRGIALIILATIAIIFALQWAKAFFIPIVFSIFVAYTLNPIVLWLERIRLPRTLGVVIVMTALLAGTGGVAASLYNEMDSISNELPLVTYKIKRALRSFHGGETGTIEKLRNMAEELKEAALPDKPAASKPSPSALVGGAGQKGAIAEKPPPTVIIQQPEKSSNDWLLAGSMGAASFFGQLIMVLFMVFFALLSGDLFKRKLVKLTPSLSNKKVAVHILDDINTSIQKYMFMLFVTNATLGLLTWVVLLAIGLDNPGAWAVVTAFLHVIPYFGVILTAVTIGLAAFIQFESFSMMLLAVASVFALSTVIGMLITTWMTGRIAKMNPTAVFVALLFGGWLWGVWGLLLCVPMVVVVRVVADRIDEMSTVAELLSE